MEEESVMLDRYERALTITNQEEMSPEICSEITQLFFDLDLSVKTVGEAMLDATSKASLVKICNHWGFLPPPPC